MPVMMKKKVWKNSFTRRENSKRYQYFWVMKKYATSFIFFWKQKTSSDLWGTPTFLQKKFPSDANVDDGTFISKFYTTEETSKTKNNVIF